VAFVRVTKKTAGIHGVEAICENCAIFEKSATPTKGHCIHVRQNLFDKVITYRVKTRFRDTCDDFLCFVGAKIQVEADEESDSND
jgi:hypothetical protein